MRKFEGFEKGINLGGWLSQNTLTKEHMDSFIKESDIEKIASMGVDHIRLPIDYSVIETEDCEDIESGYTYIDNCLPASIVMKWRMYGELACSNDLFRIGFKLSGTPSMVISLVFLPLAISSRIFEMVAQ